MRVSRKRGMVTTRKKEQLKASCCAYPHDHSHRGYAVRLPRQFSSFIHTCLFRIAARPFSHHLPRPSLSHLFDLSISLAASSRNAPHCHSTKVTFQLILFRTRLSFLLKSFKYFLTVPCEGSHCRSRLDCTRAERLLPKMAC